MVIITINTAFIVVISSDLAPGGAVASLPYIFGQCRAGGYPECVNRRGRFS